MEAVELKTKFHDLIDHIDELDVLENFYRALAYYRKLNGHKDIIDDLTKEQVIRLNESLRQSDTGNCIPHETVKTEIREWLTK